MKLLIVTGIYPPDLGGPASFVPRLASALEARGAQVGVVTLSDVISAPGDAARIIARVPRAQNRLWRMVETACAMARIGRDAPVWLVQGLPAVAAMTARLLGKRQVHKIVGDGAWERAVLRGWYTGSLDEFQMARGDVRLALLRWLNTWPLQLADTIVAPSRYLAELIVGWGIDPDRIRVIYNAAERHPGARPARAARDAFELITVCRLTPWKGVDGLLRALSQLGDCRLTIVGDGPERSRLEALAADLGVAGRVEWTGALTAARVGEALARADAFLLNSTYEGLPHIVLEAFDAGCPVIATRAGGTPEVVEHERTGLLVEPGRPDQVVEAVRRLRADPGLGEAMAGAAAAELDGRFSHSAMIDAYVTLLKAPAR